MKNCFIIRALEGSEVKRSCRRAEFRSEQREPIGDCSVCLHQHRENDAPPATNGGGE